MSTNTAVTTNGQQDQNAIIWSQSVRYNTTTAPNSIVAPVLSTGTVSKSANSEAN